MMEKICLFSYGSGEINKQTQSWNSKANGRFQLRGHFWQYVSIDVAFRLGIVFVKWLDN